MPGVTRIVHIGDVHLQAGHPRNADRLASFDQILTEGLALESLGLWLLPGDLFHTRSSVQDRNDLAARLVRAAALAPVVIVRGNHDPPGDLDVFARLKARWPVYLATRPEVLTIPLPTGETAAVACLPYPDKHGLVAAGIAPGDVVPEAAVLLDAIVLQLAHELADAIAQGAIPLFAGHVNVRGAIASTGQPQIGHEIEVDQAMLGRLPVVYWALNHIHKPQIVGPGVYAGSIAAMDHGETEAKSYVVVAIDVDGRQASWTRQPLATPPMFHITGALTREGWQPDHDFAAGERTWAGCDVRVRYRYQVSEKAALDEALVRAPYADALRLKVEAIAVPDRALRSTAVADARTLADKLRAYGAVAGVTLAARVLDKLGQLETADPTALLAAVERALAALETLPASEADRHEDVEDARVGALM